MMAEIADTKTFTGLTRAVQIGIIVRDLQRSMDLLSSIFGIGPFHIVEWPNRPDAKYWFHGQQESIKIRQAFVQAGSLELELIQPLEGTRNAYREFLDAKGEGIHHVLFETADMDQAIDQFARKGVKVLQNGTGIRPGTHWALLDTQDLIGFLIELRHRPGDSDGSSIPKDLP
jgi:catechol 2,3-dioxygenase-like lactoylglutathione lyase family enzyme